MERLILTHISESLGLSDKDIKISKKFFSEKNFEKYINSLPKYSKRSPSKYENHIKDYLIKNRSARLFDIVKGCQALGLKLQPNKPNCIFYKTLNKLVQSGKVTKKENIYVWNYNE